MAIDQETRGERIVSSLGSLNDHIEESRGFAAIIALSGILVTAAFWAVAVFSPETLAFSTGEAATRGSTARSIFIWGVVLVGTAEGAYGALNVVRRREERTIETDGDPMDRYAASAAHDQTRRNLLIATLIGLANIVSLLVFLN